MGFPDSSDSKESACNVGDLGLVPGWGRSPGEGMETHSSILAWRIPWREEPGGLQSMGSQRVGHDWANNTNILYNKNKVFTVDGCTLIWFIQNPKLHRLKAQRLRPMHHSFIHLLFSLFIHLHFEWPFSISCAPDSVWSGYWHVRFMYF